MLQQNRIGMLTFNVNSYTQVTSTERWHKILLRTKNVHNKRNVNKEFYNKQQNQFKSQYKLR